MGVVITVLLFILGVVLIVKGGDFFVDAAEWIAEVSGIPKLIIGATIVSVATTLPELLVSTIAAAQGKTEMAVGNAVGSVTANIGLILAISVLFMPSVIRRRDYLTKSILMIAASVIVLIGGVVGEISLAIAIVLLAVFAVFVYENIRGAKKSEEKHESDGKPETTKKVVIVNTVKFIAGAAGIVIGAQLLVNNGSEIARLLGVSERIIGVTIVAVGTSLPELVTTVTAIAKKQSSISVGNILGANILDLTLILPTCSLVSGKSLPVSGLSAALDLPMCLIVGLIAVVPMIISSKFRRWQGVCLLLVFSVYVYLTCTMTL